MNNTFTDILVVDDTPANVRLLANMLSTLGYKVRKATGGEMAIEAINMVLPDLILLDINMPGMDGYQVCQALKNQQKTCDIPVIFISALDEIMDKLKGFNVGGVDYITKPFQLVEVQARIKTHISLRLLQKELQLKNQLLEEERSRAGQIQADLFPKLIPTLPGFELAARCFPAQEVGGDFYDWQLLEADCLNLTLGDVMGKGMPAALLMTTVRATLRALVSQYTPATRIDAAQALLASDLGGSESFVTLFHAQLNCRDRQLSYIDAGHGLVLLRRANGEIKPLLKGGIPMGILPEQIYQSGNIVFEKNDALLVFSDGLPEVFPDAVKRPEVFKSLLQGTTSATDILNRIFSLVPADTALPDDLTVLVLYCC
jgi:phosphoserine phosphatase RsbU/P